MNRLPQNVLLNFPLELPKSDLTIYLSSGISEISYQMVSTQRREILLSFEAGLSVSKEIPYNKHKGHYFLGFRARSSFAGFQLACCFALAFGYYLLNFTTSSSRKCLSLLKSNDIDFGFYFHIVSVDDYDSLLGMYKFLSKSNMFNLFLTLKGQKNLQNVFKK